MTFWPSSEPEAIAAQVQKGETVRARLPKPVAVYLLYWTAFASGNGQMNFRDDPYGWDAALAAKIEARAGEQIAAWQRWLEKQLGSADWFGGASFGWADLSVIPYLNGSAGHGHAPSGKLGDWLARANARASVRDTMAEAKALRDAGADMGSVAKLVERGLFKREYRDHRLEWMIRSGGMQVVADGMARNTIRFTPDMR